MKRSIILLFGCCVFLWSCTPAGGKKIYTDDGTELFISSKNTDVVNVALEDSIIQIRNGFNEGEISYTIVSKEEKGEILGKYGFTKTPDSYVAIEHEDVLIYLRPFVKGGDDEETEESLYWLYIQEAMNNETGITTSTLELYDDYRFNVLDELLYLRQE